MALHHRSQITGAEAAEDPGELGEGGEESHGARVPEAEAGSPALPIDGGPDQGLELAGGGSGAVKLALHLQEAAIDLAADLDQPGQILQLAADAEVVGVMEGGLGT